MKKKITLKDKQNIQAYLNNELNIKEHKKFEDQLRLNENLRNELEKQIEISKAIQYSDLRNNIKNAHNINKPKIEVIIHKSIKGFYVELPQIGETYALWKTEELMKGNIKDLIMKFFETYKDFDIETYNLYKDGFDINYSYDTDSKDTNR